MTEKDCKHENLKFEGGLWEDRSTALLDFTCLDCGEEITCEHCDHWDNKVVYCTLCDKFVYGVCLNLTRGGKKELTGKNRKKIWRAMKNACLSKMADLIMKFPEQRKLEKCKWCDGDRMKVRNCPACMNARFIVTVPHDVYFGDK